MIRAGNQVVEGFRMSIPVAAGAVISKLDVIAVNSNGYAETASAKEGLMVAGLAQENINNRDGINGEKSITVRTGGYVLQQDGTIKNTDVLKPCYISDKNTVTITAAAPRAGTLIGVDDTYVTVLMRP